MTALPVNDRLVRLAPVAGTSSLAYDFQLTREDGLAVQRIRAGTILPLVQGTHYTFPAGLGDENGGAIALVTPSLADDIYVLIGAHPEDRLSDFLAAQGFAAAKFNTDLDALTIIAQEHRRDLQRAWTSAYGETGRSILPLPEGNFHKADANGNLVDGGSAADIINAQAYAAIASTAKDLAVSVAGGVDFDSVQTLEADETIGYALMGKALTVGANFPVRAGRHSYRVVPAGSSDYHLTNANGVRFKLFKNGRGAYDAEGVGCRPGRAKAENTARLNQLLASLSERRAVHVTEPGQYDWTQIAMPIRGTQLHGELGVTMSFDVALQTGVFVQGHECAVTGYATWKWPAEFNGLNAATTYACFWITGRRCRFEHMVIDTIPRFAFYFKDATGSVDGVRAHGRYPYLSYNEASTTGHGFVFYDPPHDALLDAGEMREFSVSNCKVRGVVQGVNGGNFGAAASMATIRITDCDFTECWDHAVYIVYGESVILNGLNCHNCRRGIVADGDAVNVQACNLYSDGVGSLYSFEQGISVRGGRQTMVRGCVVKGLGAYIDAGNVNSPRDFEEVDICDNILHATGLSPVAGINFSIRLSMQPYTVGEVTTNTRASRVRITGNRGTNRGVSTTQGIITLYGNAARPNQDIDVSGNNFKAFGVISAVYATYTERLTLFRNEFNYDGVNAAAAATLDVFYLFQCPTPKSHGNRVIWRDGGANVTLRLFNHAAGTTAPEVTGTRSFCTKGVGNLVDVQLFAGSTPAHRRDNKLDPTFPMFQQVTFPAGVNQIATANPNVSPGARIVATPANENAGAQEHAVSGIVGIPDAVNGQHIVKTSSGANTGAASLWNVEIVA